MGSAVWKRLEDFSFKSLILVIFFSSLIFASHCEIWYEDSNMGQKGYLSPDAIKKFDDEKSWKRSLTHMDVYMIRACALYLRKNHLSDYFIKHKILKLLKKHDIKLALDVLGATFTHIGKGREKEYIKEMEMINKLERMGAHIDFIYFQSSLSKAKYAGKQFVYNTYPLDRRIDDIIKYAKNVHTMFPYIKFGLIDALPIKGMPYQKPYIQLVERMEKEGLHLDGILLDGPYSLIEGRWQGLSWSKIKEVEIFVKTKLRIHFGKIYTDNKGGKRSDKLFYNNVMRMENRYSHVGGEPDYCMLTSWYPHPVYTIPEKKPYSITYILNKLVDRLEKDHKVSKK